LKEKIAEAKKCIKDAMRLRSVSRMLYTYLFLMFTLLWQFGQFV